MKIGIIGIIIVMSVSISIAEISNEITVSGNMSENVSGNISGNITYTLTVTGNTTTALIADLAPNPTDDNKMNLTYDEVRAVYDRYYKTKPYAEQASKSNPTTCSEANTEFLSIQEAVFKYLGDTGRWTKTDFQTLYNANDKLLQFCQDHPDIIQMANENKVTFDDRLHNPSLWIYVSSIDADLMTDYTDKYVYNVSCDCKELGAEHTS